MDRPHRGLARPPWRSIHAGSSSSWLFVVGIPALIATAIGSSYEGLIRRDSPLSVVTDQGGELVIFIALLALVAAAATVGLSVGERRHKPPRNVRLVFAAVVAVLALGALGAVVVRFGGPVNMVEKAYDAFKQPPSGSDTDSATACSRFRAATGAEPPGGGLNEWRDNPFLGGGAGTYEQYWNEHRPIEHMSAASRTTSTWRRWASWARSLALLLLALGAPLAAAVGAGRHPLAAGALAPTSPSSSTRQSTGTGSRLAVTVAALAAGAALMLLRAPPGSGARSRAQAQGRSGAAAALMAGAAFVGLVGSSALAASDDAAVASPPDLDEAADEARRHRTGRRGPPSRGSAWGRRNSLRKPRRRPCEPRKAIDKEPGDWLRGWRLAEASSGAEREAALREAERLNPLADEIREFRETEGQ